MQTMRYFKNVSTLTLDGPACIGCGMCVVVCPHGVLTVSSGKADIIDKDGCMECGACVKNCPTKALIVTPGVGCASYIIQTWIKGKEKAACGPGGGCC